MAAYITPLALAVPTSVAAGAAMDVRQLADVWVQLSGTFVATIDFQVSFDHGTTWSTVATRSAGDVVEVPAASAATHLRANTTGYSSGTPVAKVGGMDLALPPPMLPVRS